MSNKLLSANEIRVRFRTGMGLDISTEAIATVADRLGYKPLRFGGKIGYKSYLYTALTQNLAELRRCEEDIRNRKAFKRQKYTVQPNYYMFNGERDNVDYDFERNEGKIRRAIIESLCEMKLNEANFEAGTDHPYFEDERTGESYEATWNSDYGFPFGYWNLTDNGRMAFSVGDAYTTHTNACGKVAKRYFYNCTFEYLKEDTDDFISALEDLVNDDYEYDEENGLYVSSDGSDEIDIDEWIRENTASIDYDTAKEIVLNAIDGRPIPDYEELAEQIAADRTEEYDFNEASDIDSALKDIGDSYQAYFERGRYEGRIWPNLGMIGFYTTEQPQPESLRGILMDLANSQIDTYENLLGYVMVFENWRNGGGLITACTTSDYISENYGETYDDEEDDDEEEDDVQYARNEKTKFVPHLANQGEKREFFKNFRDTRDKALYAPRERAAGNLAAYHAMLYPFGENKERRIGHGSLF